MTRTATHTLLHCIIAHTLVAHTSRVVLSSPLPSTNVGVHTPSAARFSHTTSRHRLPLPSPSPNPTATPTPPHTTQVPHMWFSAVQLRRAFRPTG